MYCVYLTIYKGNKLPPFYIGYTKKSKIENGYRGSVSSKRFKSIWKYELKNCPDLFITKIIKTFETQTEAIQYEEFLHKQFNVHKNELYVNQSISNILFRNSLSTYTHKERTKEKISQSKKGKQRDLHTRNILKNAFSKSKKHKIACIENLKKATEKNKGSKRPDTFKAMISQKLKGRKFSKETKERMRVAAKERSKNTVCCRFCKKQLPVNSLGSHLRFCKH